MDKDNSETQWMFIFASWITAATATLGSLFFSEIAEFPPCSLCWYQRIFMYPLVFILLVGLFPLDKLVYKYAAPFAFIGLIISIYHNLLQLEIIPETMAPCLEGIPCSGIYIEWLGFITIPFLSFVAFAIIFTLMIILSRKRNYEK